MAEETKYTKAVRLKGGTKWHPGITRGGFFYVLIGGEEVIPSHKRIAEIQDIDKHPELVKKFNKTAAAGVLVGKTDIGGREGISAQQADGKPILLGGGEIIMSEKAAEDNCEELSKMNQEAGGVAFDCDLQKVANTDRASGKMPKDEYYESAAKGRHVNLKTVRITIPNEVILKKINTTPALRRLTRLHLIVGENIENVNHYQYSELLRMFPIAGVKVEEVNAASGKRITNWQFKLGDPVVFESTDRRGFLVNGFYENITNDPALIKVRTKLPGFADYFYTISTENVYPAEIKESVQGFLDFKEKKYETLLQTSTTKKLTSATATEYAQKKKLIENINYKDWIQGGAAGSKLPSTGENIQFTPLHIKMLIPEVTVVEYTRNGKRELGVVREVKEIQSMSIFQKRDSYYVVHVYRNVTGTPRVTDIISANRITGIVADPGTIWNTYGQFGRYRFFVATKEVSKQANEMKSWAALAEDTKERFTRWYAGEVFGNQGGAMAAGGQIKQGDIVDFNGVQSKVVSIFADNGTAKIIIPFESSKEGANIADDWDYDIVNLSELKPIKMAESGTKTQEKTQYQEAQRYIDNARADLKKAGLTTDGKYYYDTKYVKSAAGTAYAGAELALKWFLELRGFEAKMSDAYEIKRHLSMINKKMLKTFNTVYETLHKNIYYGSDTRKSVVDGVIDAAEDLIAYLRPYKQPAVYEAGAKTNPMETNEQGKKVIPDEILEEQIRYDEAAFWYNNATDKEITIALESFGWKPYKFRTYEGRSSYPTWEKLGLGYGVEFGNEARRDLIQYVNKLKHGDVAASGAKTNPIETKKYKQSKQLTDFKVGDKVIQSRDIDSLPSGKIDSANSNLTGKQGVIKKINYSGNPDLVIIDYGEGYHSIVSNKKWIDKVYSKQSSVSGAKTNPMETENVIFSIDDGNLDSIFLEQFDAGLDYLHIKKDVFYVLSRSNYDRFIDFAISSGYDVANVIDEFDEKGNLIPEAYRRAASGAKTPLPDKLTLYPMPDFHYLKIGNLIKDTQGNQSKIVRHTDTGIVLKPHQDIPYDLPEAEMTFEDFCEKMDDGFVIPGCPYDTDVESDRCLLRKEISLIKMGKEVNAKESRIKRLEEEGETERAAMRAEAERQREEGETERAAMRAEAERQREEGETERAAMRAEAERQRESSDAERSRLRGEYEDTIEGLNVLKELNLPPDVKKLKEEYEDTIEGLKVLNQTNGREMQGGGHMDGRASGQPYSTVRINTKEQGIIFKKYGRLVSKQEVLEDMRAKGLTVLDLRISDHKSGFIVQRSGLQGGGKAGSFTDYYLVVNLDERGEYSASVLNPNDTSVFDINTELLDELIIDGSLKYQPDEDLDGLTKYLMESDIIPNGSQIWSEEQFEDSIREQYEMAGGGKANGEEYGEKVSEKDIEERIEKYEGQGYEHEKAVEMTAASIAIGDVGEDVLAGGGKVKKITKKDKYYHARFKSPKGATTCRVPEWTKPIVRDIHKGAKVTTCKYKDNGSEKWAVQKVMIPVGNGMTKAKAKSIAEQIGDKLLTSKN